MKIDYYAYLSGIKDWNPGVKVFWSVATLCLVIGLNRLPVSLFVIVTMGAVTMLPGRLSPRIYLHYMMAPLLFLIISSLMIAVEFGTHPVGEYCVHVLFFYTGVTEEGMMSAASVFLKAIAGISALYMMAFSTPIYEIIRLLQKLHVPGMLTELMYLIYRFVFLLFDAANELQTAAKARGGYRTFHQSLRTFAGIAGNLFLISLKKANTYYDAMVSRGYDGKIEFLSEEKPVKVWQIACCLCYFALLVLIALAG